MGQCQKQVEVAELLIRAENCSANLPASSPLWDLVNLYVTWDLFCSACKWEHMFICEYTIAIPRVWQEKHTCLGRAGLSWEEVTCAGLATGQGWLVKGVGLAA